MTQILNVNIDTQAFGRYLNKNRTTIVAALAAIVLTATLGVFIAHGVKGVSATASRALTDLTTLGAVGSYAAVAAAYKHDKSRAETITMI